MPAESADWVIGIDSGTQSTKVLVLDTSSAGVVATGSAPHEMIRGLPPGHLEQHPSIWFEALDQALRQALDCNGVDRGRIGAMGVSGQQHGFVPLDASGQVIRPAKLWCDTSTVEECLAIMDRLGGPGPFLQATGNGLPPGFTASKIEWLKTHEPENYARLSTVLLPHDYLNFRLTGELRMECGDASGTGLLDIRTRTWCQPALDAIDSSLAAKVPPLIESHMPVGRLLPELAKRWRLRDDVLVSSGGGDNMMAAIGSGAVTPGVVTVSLGTSGTIFAYSPSAMIDPGGDVAAFCDSTGAWLPLVCTMNVTVATELTKRLFGMDNAALSAAVSQTPAGSDGLMLIPYFDGERTPNVPDGAGVWFGATRRNQTPGHFARAAMEGALLGLKYGLQRLKTMGLAPTDIRLIGGGSYSAAWRRIAADVFQTTTACLAETEAAALGAAIQAAWCRRTAVDEASVDLPEMVSEIVRLDEPTRATPTAGVGDVYTELLALHEQVAKSLGEAFSMHREFISGAGRLGG